MRGVNPQKAAERAQALEALLSTLLQAGARGLTPIELAQAVGLTHTSNLTRTQAKLAAQGRLYILSQHPVYILYHADVPRASAEALLPARVAGDLAQRAHKRSTTLAQRAGRPAPAAPSPVLRRTTTLRAVDPHALRRDATVTVPEGLQVQHLPCGKDTRHSADPSHRGELCALPLGQYATEARPWVRELWQAPNVRANQEPTR